MSKKLNKLLLILIISFSNHVSALSLIDTLIGNYSKTNSTLNSSASKISDKPYTDFSGTWLADCGASQPTTTVIANDANSITIDGEKAKIGQGLQETMEATAEYTSFLHKSYEWNLNGTQLVMKIVMVSKNTKDNMPIKTEVGVVTYSMNHDQIFIDGKFVTLDDITPSEDMSGHCVLTKT